MLPQTLKIIVFTFEKSRLTKSSAITAEQTGFKMCFGLSKRGQGLPNPNRPYYRPRRLRDNGTKRCSPGSHEPNFHTKSEKHELKRPTDSANVPVVSHSSIRGRTVRKS